MIKEIKLTVNGEPREVAVKPGTLLVEVLSNELGLTGARMVCSSGACGTCTILLDGKAVKSCSVLALQANGKEVMTIEGLANNGQLHPLQKAFVEHNAFQCGFCTPGMILSAKALLDENPNPTDEEVKMSLVGNLCRCTGYTKIIEAIQVAARELRGG